MKSKIVKRTNPKPKTVTHSEKDIIKFQRKCLAYETKIFKLEQIIFKLKQEKTTLQEANRKLQSPNAFSPVDLSKYMNHGKPPKIIVNRQLPKE